MLSDNNYLASYLNKVLNSNKAQFKGTSTGGTEGNSVNVRIGNTSIVATSLNTHTPGNCIVFKEGGKYYALGEAQAALDTRSSLVTYRRVRDIPSRRKSKEYLLRSLVFSGGLAFLGGDRNAAQASPDPVFGFAAVGRNNLIAGRKPDNTYFVTGTKNWEYQSTYSLQWGNGDFFFRNEIGWRLEDYFPTQLANYTPGFNTHSPVFSGTEPNTLFGWFVSSAQENFWFFNTGPYLTTEQRNGGSYVLSINRTYDWSVPFGDIPSTATIIEHAGTETQIASPIGSLGTDSEFSNPGECSTNGDYSSTASLPGISASNSRDLLLRWQDTSRQSVSLSDGAEVTETQTLDFSQIETKSADVLVPQRNRYTNTVCIFTGGLTGDPLGKHQFNRSADPASLTANHTQNLTRTYTGSKTWGIAPNFNFAAQEVENFTFSLTWQPVTGNYSSSMSATFAYQSQAQTIKNQLTRRIADDLAESAFYSVVRYEFDEAINKTETRNINLYQSSSIVDSLFCPTITTPPNTLNYSDHNRLAPITGVSGFGTTVSMSGSATQTVRTLDTLRFWDGSSDIEVGYFSLDDRLFGSVSEDLSSKEVGDSIILPTILLKLRGESSKNVSLPSTQNFLSGIAPTWVDYDYASRFIGKQFIVQRYLGDNSWDVFICTGQSLGSQTSTQNRTQTLNSGVSTVVGQVGVFANSTVQVNEILRGAIAPLLVSTSDRFFRFEDVGDLVNGLYSAKHLTLRKSTESGVVWDCYVANAANDGVGARQGYYTKFQVLSDYSLSWDRKQVKSDYIPHAEEYGFLKVI